MRSLKTLKVLNILFIAVFCLFLASCSKTPEVIYINGKIYTLDKNNTIVEAIAVYDGRILALGKSSELTEKYKNAKVIDLKGKTVVPGFIDAEANLMEFSKQLSLLDLRNARSVDEILNIVRERVKTSKPNDWIGGFGWDELKLSEADLAKLHHTLLDGVSAQQNIYLVNALGNTTWVNKKVLELTKVNKDTPDPENGEIGFDDSGNPTGLFYEAAQELVINILPQPSEQEVMGNISRGINELFKYGITEINDANITEQGLSVYKKMVDDNKFPIRLYAMIPGKGPLFEKYLQSGPENYKDRINIKCFSLEYDGYFENQDAAMENDYNEEPKRMIPFNDEFDIKEMTSKANEKDFQVSVKTVGDRALTNTLNAIESVNKEVKSKAGRMRLEYLEFVNPADMQRIKQLEIIPSIRPEVTLTDKVIVGEIIKPENMQNLGLWNNLYKQNNIIVSGTDFPYHTISPLIVMYYLSSGLALDTAANRIANNTAQKLTVMEALRSFTVYSAYASFAEELKGTLEKDKLADMVVLSEDILNSDPAVLLKTNVLMTIIRGEVVYENKNPAAYLY
ncbi:MAG: amidohydrolase 3 [Chlorobi bacterium OLB5]|nr:MAG: amidohydrolase 3 [Chlorobi bacterium OLB5]